MKSEWRVRYNPNFPENPYNAYRLRDAYKVVEGGNVEPDFMYFEHRRNRNAGQVLPVLSRSTTKRGAK